MSKKLARGSESYRNEELVIALVPELLSAKGFQSVRVRRPAGMKIVEATSVGGSPVAFWLKQGWSTTPNYSAIQFGMFDADSNPRSLPDSAFVDYVAARTESAKRRGATHALLVHMFDESIRDYVALRIEDLTRAYARQIDEWPARARNTRTPTLYFEDSRAGADAACITAVTDLEIPLEIASGLSSEPFARAGSKKVTVEIERRFQQQAFRVRVGSRCNWRCAISGVAIREVLDAAHLPGRDWRTHNEATDGVLLRADLHRLIDRGLAEIQGGKFMIKKSARVGEYAGYHGQPLVS